MSRGIDASSLFRVVSSYSRAICSLCVADYSPSRFESVRLVFFFFQAEDGIRDVAVTGVQTCALPISGMSLAILLMQLKLAGVHTLASTVHGAEVVGARFSASQSSDAAPPLFAPWEVDWCQPVALLVGNEGAGLPEELERSAEVRVRIPMASGVDRFAVTHKVDSLNAAAAAAVLFYEAARQRKLLTGSGVNP